MSDFDAEDCLERYRRLMAAQPGEFEARPGDPIRVLTNADDMKRAQEAVRDAKPTRGMSYDDFRIGVLTGDGYCRYVRDAVSFPDGSVGLFRRILVPNGTVVLPLLDDGRVALIRIYRHPTRSWMIEAPRGALENDLSIEEVARKEVAEEIDAEVTGDLIDLGIVHTTSGMSEEWMRLWAAKVSDPQGVVDQTEGIDAILTPTVAEVEAMILDGRITDGITIAAFTRARLRGIV